MVVASCILLLGLLADSAAAPAPAGTLLVVRPDEDAVVLVDLATGDESGRLTTNRVPHRVAVAADGRTAAVGEWGKKRTPGQSVAFVDLTERTVTSRRDLGEHAHPEVLAFLPDGRLAVLSQKSGHVVLVPRGETDPLSSVATPSAFPGSLAIAPDGRLAVVTHPSSGSATIVDLHGVRAVSTFDVGAEADGVVIVKNGREAWVAMQSGDRIAIVDLESGQVVGSIPCSGFPIRLAFDPSRNRVLVTCSRSHEIVAFDVAARKEVARRRLDPSKHPDWPRLSAGNPFGATPVPMDIVVARDGALAYVAADLAKAVLEIDADTLEIRRILAPGGRPQGLALSPTSAGSRTN